MNTSGSSGQPLRVRRTWSEQRLLNAFLLRANRDLGLRVRDHVAGISVRPRSQKDQRKLARLLGRLGIFKTTTVSRALDAEQILADLKSLKPDVVTAYPSVLNRIASVMSDEDRDVLEPRFLMTGAETLSAHYRSRIVAGFGAPVFDVYSSVEFHNLGWECPETGFLHLADDAVVVEVLRDGRPVEVGEDGEVVGTALHSFAMPFIRYGLGDIVTRGPDPCLCGRPFSSISRIRGKVGDYILLPSGRSVHVVLLEYPILTSPCPWLLEYQFVRVRPELLRLQAVVSSAPTPEELSELEGRLKAQLGGEVGIEICLVSRIAPDPSGKQRVFVANP